MRFNAIIFKLNKLNKMSDFIIKKQIRCIFYTLLCVVTFSSCSSGVDGNKYNGLILTDNKTGRVYLLRHNTLDSYFIDEKVIKIIGKDTTEVFE